MRKKTIATRLICTKCGNIQTIYRKAYRQKKIGHLKSLWCYKCKERVNHYEICGEDVIFENGRDLEGY